VNVVARTTHTQGTQEINWIGHGYQTHISGYPRQHLLSVVMHHAAGNMLYPHALLPE